MCCLAHIDFSSSFRLSPLLHEVDDVVNGSEGECAVRCVGAACHVSDALALYEGKRAHTTKGLRSVLSPTAVSRALSSAVLPCLCVARLLPFTPFSRLCVRTLPLSAVSAVSLRGAVPLGRTLLPVAPPSLGTRSASATPRAHALSVPHRLCSVAVACVQVYGWRHIFTIALRSTPRTNPRIPAFLPSFPHRESLSLSIMKHVKARSRR